MDAYNRANGIVGTAFNLIILAALILLAGGIAHLIAKLFLLGWSVL